MSESMSKKVPQLLVALVALFGAIAVAVVVLGTGGADTTAEQRPPVEIGADDLSPGDEAVRSAQRFLDTYVAEDGRVERPQDGDTVSEGQAYAMLIAVALDDEETFASVWSWSRDNLLGPSGTLAWKWKDGRIVDPNAATDADLDTARALLMAGDRFDEPQYATAGVDLANALAAEDLVVAADTTVLVAGPWATEAPYVWNPSYLAPASFDAIARATGDTAWTDAREDGTDLLDELTNGGTRLPSDWARLGDDGVAAVASSPDGTKDPTFGFDAFRTIARLSEACDAPSRELAAALSPSVERAIDAGTLETDLDGNPRDGTANPLFLLAASAAVEAAGDDARANELADAAEQVAAASPSYYLDAWVALTRLIVDTDRLDVCGAPAGAGSSDA